ncbi:hypothetical protein D3C71_1424470 [compost metagenome]
MPTILHAIHLDYAHVPAPCFDTNSTSTQVHDWLLPKRMPQQQDYACVASSMIPHALSLPAQTLLQFQFASSMTSHAPFFPSYLSLSLEHSPLRQYGLVHHAKYNLGLKAVAERNKHEPQQYLVLAMKPMNQRHRLIEQ